MRHRWVLLLAALALLVGCDHGTKHWAETSLQHAPRPVVAGVLDLQYAANRDNAFSLSRRVLPPELKRPLLLAAGTVATVFVAALWYRRRSSGLREQAAYVLMMAGALGNVADRIVRGYVVDFIRLRYWPVFNVADVLLVAGIGLLLVSWPRRSRAAPS